MYQSTVWQEANIQVDEKSKEGETRTEDRPHNARPSTVTTDSNCQWVDKLIHTDRQITICELATQLVCGYNTIH